MEKNPPNFSSVKFHSKYFGLLWVKSETILFTCEFSLLKFRLYTALSQQLRPFVRSPKICAKNKGEPTSHKHELKTSLRHVNHPLKNKKTVKILSARVDKQVRERNRGKFNVASSLSLLP